MTASLSQLWCPRRSRPTAKCIPQCARKAPDAGSGEVASGGVSQISACEITGARYTVFELAWEPQGPRLTPIDRPTRFSPFEAPNYLATRDPDRVGQLFQEHAFRCLRRC